MIEKTPSWSVSPRAREQQRRAPIDESEPDSQAQDDPGEGPVHPAAA